MTDRWPTHLAHPDDTGRSVCGKDISPGGEHAGVELDVIDGVPLVDHLAGSLVDCGDCLAAVREPTVTHPRAPVPDSSAPETGVFVNREWAWGPRVWEDGMEEAVFPVRGRGPHRAVMVWVAGDGRRCIYDRHRGVYTVLTVWPAPIGPEWADAQRMTVITNALAEVDRLNTMA